MRRRAVSIALKIPDNEAYTALVALQRLGVEVARVERSEIYLFDDGGDLEELRARVTTDETIFNPNKHRLDVLDSAVPRAGEVWIELLAPPPKTRRLATAWRLYTERDAPVKRPALDAAVERLLCNPAIERALTKINASDRDILDASE